jgi:hypothetical protein
MNSNDEFEKWLKPRRRGCSRDDIEFAKTVWQAATEVQKAKDLAAVEALNNVLDFAVGAITDAIYHEDGLDGGTGERVLQLIAEVKKHGTFNVNLVERDEMLRMFNLASDESTAT